MSLLDSLIQQATTSPFYRRCLSLALRHVVPFNNPHRLSIREFHPGRATVAIPFCRRNKNHLGTIHACVMAAAGEYAAGLAIISVASPTKYRVIIRELQVTYLLQGRGDLSARCELGDTLSLLRDFSGSAAATAEALELESSSDILDETNQLCARVCTHWQIKLRA